MEQRRRLPDRRATEIARLQSTFREVNERIEEISERAADAPLLIVCECGDLACREMLELTAAEYRALRESPARFAVAPGHEIRGVECVVASNERFTTVEKLGASE